MIRATIIGFVLGAVIPIALGMYTLHEMSDRASTVTDANIAFCGMEVIGAWLLIYAGGPIGALCGGVIGLVGALIYRLISDADAD